MIFVTLGTQDKQFVRLLDAVEKLDTDEKIIMQIGSTEFSSKKPKEQVEINKFITLEQFYKYMEEARVVISHAGVGTILYGLKLHKKMIVAARKVEFHEHVNNHQEQILNTFAKEGYIWPLTDFNKLNKLIEQEFKPKNFKSNNEVFNKNLDKEIKRLTSKGEKWVIKVN